MVKLHYLEFTRKRMTGKIKMYVFLLSFKSICQSFFSNVTGKRKKKIGSRNKHLAKVSVQL